MTSPESVFSVSPNVSRALDWLERNRLHQQAIPFNRWEDPTYQAIRNELQNRIFRPTLLRPAEINELTPNTYAIVTEIGGTQMRLKVYKAIDENTVELVKDDLGNDLSIEPPITNKKFKNPDAFFKSMLTLAQPVIEKIKELKIPVSGSAVIYSFDGIGVEQNGQILIHPKEKMSKGFTVKGISRVFVGERVSKLLSDVGVTFIDNYAMVDLNDGPATMLSRIGARMSDIGGTGSNHSIVLYDKDGLPFMWNMETGDLNTLPLTLPEEVVNWGSESSGHHKSEMRIGGQSIVDVTNYIISQMMHHGILKLGVNQWLTGANFSDILKGNKAAFLSIFERFNRRDTDTWRILSEIALREWQNAVYYESLIIAAAIDLHPRTFPKRRVYIPTDGRKFWKTPGYAQMVKLTVESYQPDHSIHFIQASGSDGAAFGVLRRVHENNSIK